jgi:hypothetical protein
MSLNIKIVLLSILGLLIISVSLLFSGSTKELSSSKESFHKLAKELQIIENIKNYYGDEKTNQKKLHRLTDQYKKNIVFLKEEKDNIEFKMANLSKDKLYQVTKNIVDGGFKVLNLKVSRMDDNKAEFNCKVLF